MFLKKYLKTFIQGIVVGFALISGMGGGTVAILMGIYDDLIIAIADFTKHPKASLQLLIPLLIGALVGIGALIVPINLALRYFPFPATSLFVGLTIGGFRSLKKRCKDTQIHSTLCLLSSASSSPLPLGCSPSSPLAG